LVGKPDSNHWKNGMFNYCILSISIFSSHKRCGMIFALIMLYTNLKLVLHMLHVDQERRVWKIFPLTFGSDIENYERGIYPPTTPSCPFSFVYKP
jgi:hypothetical protein